jgi:imidazolonepropionase
MTESLPLIMNLACTQMRMLPGEAITAATINAAWAIGEQDCVGSLEVGKQADVLVLDAPSHEHLCYHFGVNLADTVVKNGKVVVRAGSGCAEKKSLGRIVDVLVSSGTAAHDDR